MKNPTQWKICFHSQSSVLEAEQTIV